PRPAREDRAADGHAAARARRTDPRPRAPHPAVPRRHAAAVGGELRLRVPRGVRRLRRSLRTRLPGPLRRLVPAGLGARDRAGAGAVAAAVPPVAEGAGCRRPGLTASPDRHPSTSRSSPVQTATPTTRPASTTTPTTASSAAPAGAPSAAPHEIVVSDLYFRSPGPARDT